MNAYTRLRRLFNDREFLAIDPDTETCRLIGQAEAMRLVLDKEHGGQPMTHVFPIGRGLPGFADRVGKEDREFGIAEVAKLAGAPYQTIDNWIRSGSVTASIETGFQERRKFSYLDAWVATVQGSLRRFGASLPTLKRAGAAIREAYQAMEQPAQPAPTEAANA